MLRSAPSFWRRDGLVPALLAPAGWGYAAAGALRRAWAAPWQAPVPVVCVGNLVAGGAGKTPVALDLARRLAQRGAHPHILTRGYGGSRPGPLLVDRARHGFHEVGDEALLLAAAAPTWVARDRVKGARAAVAAGAGALVLDDGFQNPRLHQDLRLLVVDGIYGFGNGRLLPAGPLREPISSGLERADAVIIMGDDTAGVRRRVRWRPALAARLAPTGDAPSLAGARLVPFAGIGAPEKFFALLGSLGAEIVQRYRFPDHHAFGETELRAILAAAERSSAVAITTEKDGVRLPPEFRARVRVLPVEVAWDDPALLERLLDRLPVARGRP